jgi:hypothetical protein
MKRLIGFISIAVALAALSATPAKAGEVLLYSWETGLEGWTSSQLTLANSTTLGVTQGTQSLLLDNIAGTGSKTLASVTHGSGSGATYDKWAQAAARIAAGDTDLKIEFDFSFDNSLASAAFAQLNITVNSNSPPGFKQYGLGNFIGGNIGSSFPMLQGNAVTEGVTLTGSGNTRHVTVPLGGPGKSLTISNAAGSFYQMSFQYNGGATGTVDWAIDNLRITGANIVPEPAALGLAVLGMTGLLGSLRKRR